MAFERHFTLLWYIISRKSCWLRLVSNNSIELSLAKSQCVQRSHNNKGERALTVLSTFLFLLAVIAVKTFDRHQNIESRWKEEEEETARDDDDDDTTSKALTLREGGREGEQRSRDPKAMKKRKEGRKEGRWQWQPRRHSLPCHVPSEPGSIQTDLWELIPILDPLTM